MRSPGCSTSGLISRASSASFSCAGTGACRRPSRKATPDQLALLPPETAALIERTRQFYARIQRLDRGWRARFEMEPAAIHRLRERLGRAVAQI